MTGVRYDEKEVLVEIETHGLEHVFHIYEILVTAFPIPLAFVHQDATTSLIEVGDQVEESFFEDVIGLHVHCSETNCVPKLQSCRYTINRHLF